MAIDPHTQYTREHASAYVRDALNRSGLSRKAFAEKCEIAPKAMNDYLRGKYAPALERIFAIYRLTGIPPDDYGIPVLNALECVMHMRALWRKGRNITSLAKELQIEKWIIGKLVDGSAVSLNSLLRFREAWVKNRVWERSELPQPRPEKPEMPAKSRQKREYDWIKRIWTSLAKNAKEVSDGFWVWYSNSLFRMELERKKEGTYIFRSITIATNEIYTQREVQI